jgi:short-subunit dehydrogenase
MIPQKSGAIVNISSYACFFGFPSIAAYCASKGAFLVGSVVMADGGFSVQVGPTMT